MLRQIGIVMTTIVEPKDRNGAYALASTVAREIAAAFRSHSPQYYKDDNGEERPVQFVVHSPSLAGQNFRTIDSLIYNFGHAVAYGEKTPLRRGFGIISRLVVENGVYTGAVEVQAAMDDYDM